jgi:hypothetical protein
MIKVFIHKHANKLIDKIEIKSYKSLEKDIE